MSELHKPSIGLVTAGMSPAVDSLIRATLNGSVEAEIGLIVSAEQRNADRLAREYEIPVRHINSRTHPGGRVGKNRQTLEESEAITKELSVAKVGLIAIIGYNKMPGEVLLRENRWAPGENIFQAKIICSHLGWLSKKTKGLFGLEAHQAIVDKKLPGTAQTLYAVGVGYKRNFNLIEERTVWLRRDDDAKSLFKAAKLVEKEDLPGQISNFLLRQAQLKEK